MKSKPNEALLTAESEVTEASRRLRLANEELMDAEKYWGDCNRRYEALLAQQSAKEVKLTEGAI